MSTITNNEHQSAQYSADTDGVSNPEVPANTGNPANDVNSGSPVSPPSGTGNTETTGTGTTIADGTAAITGTATTTTRLGTRDYISIGVYTVLYFVMISIGALITHLIPVGMPFAGFACGLLGTTPLLLLMSKSRRFGAISIMGILLALLMGAVHGNYYTVATSLIAAILADLIATKTGSTSDNNANGTDNAKAPARSTGITLASVSVFNLWSIGMFLPFYIGRSTYLQQLTARKGAEYASRLAGLFPAWTLPVVIVLGLLGGLLGGLIGLAMFRRHFERAGLA